jgi:hypothetical protein
MLQNWYACASTSICVEADIGRGLLGRLGRRYRKRICRNHVNCSSYADLIMIRVALIWSETTHTYPIRPKKDLLSND